MLLAVKGPALRLKVDPNPSVAAYSSLMMGMLKRSRKGSHTSGRIPLPQAICTLCFRSYGFVGPLSKYRQSSPTYCMMVASEAATSGQKVLCENFLLSTIVLPAWTIGVTQSPCAAPW